MLTPEFTRVGTMADQKDRDWQPKDWIMLVSAMAGLLTALAPYFNRLF